MPTQTQPEQTLEERLSELERQRRQAADAITLAAQRIEEIAARQREIAVAVVGEDAEAVAENEQLEEALLIENRRRATARSAAEQLDAAIEQVKEELAEAKRRGHLRQAAQLARDRYDLEVQAEEQVAALLQTLTELKAVDGRQRGALSQGGDEQPGQDLLAWNSNIESWLLTRLGRFIGENPRHQEFATKSLSEFDGLASEATPEDA